MLFGIYLEFGAWKAWNLFHAHEASKSLKARTNNAIIPLLYTRGCSIMVITTGFQPEDRGSIPLTRSIQKKDLACEVTS